MESLHRKFSWQLAGDPRGQLWSQQVRLVTGRGWLRCHLQQPWRAGRDFCLCTGDVLEEATTFAEDGTGATAASRASGGVVG